MVKKTGLKSKRSINNQPWRDESGNNFDDSRLLAESRRWDADTWETYLDSIEHPQTDVLVDDFEAVLREHDRRQSMEAWNAATHLRIEMTQSEFNGAISGLTPNQQQLLRKYFWEKKTYEQIGDQMGKTRQAVEQAVTRAIRQLRKTKNGHSQRIARFGKACLVTMLLALVVSCGKKPEPPTPAPPVSKPEAEQSQPHSAPHKRPKSPEELDVLIPYFSNKPKIKLLKKLEFSWSGGGFRGITFHNGKDMGTDSAGGSHCYITQRDSHSDLGIYRPQELKNVTPVRRNTETPFAWNDLRFAGAAFEFATGGRAIVFCIRHETLGPVVLQDFKDHFHGWLEFE